MTNHALGSMILANNPGPTSNLNNNSNMNVTVAGTQPPNNGAPQGSTGPNVNNANI